MRSNYIVKRPHEHTATMCNLPRLPCNLPFSIFFLVCLAGTAKKCWAPQPAWWEEQGQAQAQSNCIQLQLKSYQVKLGQVSQDSESDSEDAMALWVWGLCWKMWRPHWGLIQPSKIWQIFKRLLFAAGSRKRQEELVDGRETRRHYCNTQFVAWCGFDVELSKALQINIDKPKCFSGSHAGALLFLLMDGLKREQPWRLNDGESLHILLLFTTHDTKVYARA